MSLLDDMCRVDGTRLAVPGSTSQMENIVKFLVEEEPTWGTGPEEPADSRLFLGFREVQQSRLSSQFAFQCCDLPQLLNTEKNVPFSLNLQLIFKFEVFRVSNRE